jgi:ATP-binding cassette subfamily C protein
VQSLRTIIQAFSLLDRPLRLLALLSLLASLVTVVLETCSIFLVYPLILAIVGADASVRIPFLSDVVAWLPKENSTTTISILIVGLMAGKSVISVALVWWQQGFLNRGAAKTAGRLLNTYMAAPLIWHQSKNSAELQRNVNTSVRLVFSYIIFAALAIASELIVLVLMAAVLMLVAPAAVAIAAAAFAISMVGYQLIFARMPAVAGRRQERESMLVIKELNQALGAIRELRLTGRVQHVADAFLARKMAQAAAFRSLGTLAAVPRAYLELTVTVVLVAAVIWLARQGDGTTAIATLGLFGAAMLRMLPSVHRILSQLQLVYVGAASLANVADDLKVASDPKSAVAKPFIPRPLREGIEIRNVSFAYPGEPSLALDRIDVRIARGECVGVVGASGAGKSTLVDVVLGLLTPQQGAVLIDGEPLTGEPSRWIGIAGYVPQSIFLLDDTLKRNIALGLPEPEINDAQLHQAVEKAQLTDFVAGLADGLETVIGEEGVRLSGGQRQRVGIARALYGDPAVLVMDEGTSALDNETENRLTKAIELLRGEKTILLIAHRLSTVQHCDRILFMQQGRVVDQGRFGELSARHPDFARLVEMAKISPAKTPFAAAS